MAARQDGYRAACEVAVRLIVTETLKLPRLARMAMTKSEVVAEHPVGYSQEILRSLEQLPVPLIPWQLDVDAFHTHLRSVKYPMAYAGGPLSEGGNRENKLLEYFISLQLLDLQRDDVVIDVASERSIFGEVVRTTCGATMFRQDLIFPEGIHGDRIGGSAASMPLRDGFADKLVLHNSFEHFEGTADTDFVVESWRVLKPGGIALIVPLFVSNRYCIITDPLTNRRGVEWDPGATIVELPGWHNRFGRFYDAAALQKRILAAAISVGYTVEILHFVNVQEVDPLATMHFALLMRKPRDDEAASARS
jgi:SAM-dependent methyltransferase